MESVGRYEMTHRLERADLLLERPGQLDRRANEKVPVGQTDRGHPSWVRKAKKRRDRSVDH